MNWMHTVAQWPLWLLVGSLFVFSLATAWALVDSKGTVTREEFNSAFVLMQYFGYLRRNPNDPQDTDYTGYDFWLTKLNQSNGNFILAEMIKAFLSSIE